MLSDQEVANLMARVQQLELLVASKGGSSTPTSGMMSPNFLTRAFSAWGHVFVANLLISLVIGCVFGLISLILGASAVGWINNLLNSFR